MATHTSRLCRGNAEDHASEGSERNGGFVELIIPEGIEKCFLAQRSEPQSAEEYAAACAFDVSAMAPYLLQGDVLDIGCGVGGPTALIAQHCGGKLHLLDGTGWGKRRVAYGQAMGPYNERAMTERLLRANGVEEFTWWPVGATELPRVDNVVSLISWGWHYPVETYLEPVTEALRPGGRLILDLRPGQYGEKALTKSFALVAYYQGFGKCNKTVWERRA
jgi:SAM-dependent methyltransferase